MKMSDVRLFHTLFSWLSIARHMYFKCFNGWVELLIHCISNFNSLIEQMIYEHIGDDDIIMMYNCSCVTIISALTHSLYGCEPCMYPLTHMRSLPDNNC